MAIPVTPGEWAVAGLRLVAIVGMGYGAWEGWRRWRADKLKSQHEAKGSEPRPDTTSETERP